LIDIRKIKNLLHKEAVLDNNVLNDVAELDAFHVLHRVFSTLYIPKSILENEARFGDLLSHLTTLTYVATSIEEEATYVFFLEIVKNRPGLSEYDAECIAIAKEKFINCTSNEKRITNTCDEYGIDSTGTVGIICCAYEHGMIDKTYFESVIKMLFSDACSAHLSNRLKVELFETYKITQ
jgi:predicted nucleic acid-binding protein